MDPGWVERVRGACRGAAVGDPLRYLESVPSTNDVAREWLAAGGPSGLAVLAGEQTAGRGRRGRHWSSPAGMGIYVSVGLRPPPAAAAQLTFLGAVAAAEALRAAGIEATIRWPNDVEVRGRKVAGVLAELRQEGERPGAAVVGIGLNVGQGAGDFPPEIAGQATSVRLEREGADDPEGLAIGLLTRLAAWWAPIAERAEEAGGALLRRWRDLSPSHAGAEVWIDAGGEPFSGITRGIEADGALRVERADGRVTVVRVGELHRLDRR